MKIRLNEIPEEGRQYLLNRQTAELNTSLQDLVGASPYEVNLYIRPINSRDFDLAGEIKTQTREQCSRCGTDFDYPVFRRIHEILIPEPEQDRTGKYAKSSTPISESEDSLNVSHYRGQQFDFGEFVHEAVALDIPFSPCCVECEKNGQTEPFVYDEKMGEETKPNPFQSLKDLKLN
jgi:uncharacterized protein